MLRDLSGIDRKLARASEHLNAVENEERRWAEAQREFVVVEPQPDPIQPTPGLVHFGATLETVVPLPRSIPPIVGDCIQNLRAALDQLAWQLVTANGGTPGEHTAFPIYDTRLTEAKDPKVRTIGIEGGIDPGALAIIEEAQPYQRSDDPTEHPLWLLRELSNIDKHRLPLLVAGGVGPVFLQVGLGGGGGFQVTREGMPLAAPLKAGAELSRSGLTVGQFQQYPHVQAHVTFRIAFGEGEVCAMQPVTNVLKALSESVRGIVDTLRLFVLPAAYRQPSPNPPPPISAEARERALQVVERLIQRDVAVSHGTPDPGMTIFGQ